MKQNHIVLFDWAKILKKLEKSKNLRIWLLCFIIRPVLKDVSAESTSIEYSPLPFPLWVSELSKEEYIDCSTYWVLDASDNCISPKISSQNMFLKKYKYIKSAGNGIVWTYIIIQYQIWVVFNLHHSWSFVSSRSHSRNPSAQGRPAVQGHRHPERRKVKRFSSALNLVSMKTVSLFSFFLDDPVYIHPNIFGWDNVIEKWAQVMGKCSYGKKYNALKWSLSTSWISSVSHCNMNALIKQGSHQVQHISKWSVFGMIHDHLEEIFNIYL